MWRYIQSLWNQSQSSSLLIHFPKNGMEVTSPFSYKMRLFNMGEIVGNIKLMILWDLRVCIRNLGEGVFGQVQEIVSPPRRLIRVTILLTVFLSDLIRDKQSHFFCSIYLYKGVTTPQIVTLSSTNKEQHYFFWALFGLNFGLVWWSFIVAYFLWLFDSCGRSFHFSIWVFLFSFWIIFTF